VNCKAKSDGGPLAVTFVWHVCGPFLVALKRRKATQESLDRELILQIKGL
jgi:hypothetical protein